MATTAPRFRPNYLRSPDLFEICAAYTSAHAAFDAGNYYVALLKAEDEGDREIAALSRLMCGNYAGGMAALTALEAPSEKVARFQSLCHWIARDKTAAHSSLEEATDTALINLIGKDDLHLLIICGPHTDRAVPDPAPPGFTLHTLCTNRDKKAPSLEAALPNDVEIDAVIVFDVYGPRLPDGLFELAAPIIFLPYDLDFQLHHQYDDLCRADLIVVNSAFEHAYADGLYPGPVTAYPAFGTAFANREIAEPAAEKDLDVIHTGLSFTPIMREKTQFLFRLAVLDDESLNIQIHHGFLDKADYLEKVRRAKFWPVCNGRSIGGLTDRVADGLSSGAVLFVPEDDVASRLLDQGSSAIVETPEANLESRFQQSLANWTSTWPELVQDWSEIAGELHELLGESTTRTEALFKYCLFEAARRQTEATAQTVGTKAAAMDHSRDCSGLFHLLSQTLQRPADQTLVDQAKATFDKAIALHPRSLTLPFNMGRTLWALGDRQTAIRLLQQAVDNSETGHFDPRHEDIWLHLFKGTNEMMPYEDYFMANALELSRGFTRAPTGRAVIAATAKTYLALNALQNNNFNEGHTLLDEALSDFPDHWPAAKLRCKTLYAMAESGSQSDWDAVVAAFDHAVELYPPVISELVPFGISAELARGNEDGAAALAKTWAYFATRVTWEKDDDHPIPDATWKCVHALFDRLPDHLQRALQERYPGKL